MSRKLLLVLIMVMTLVALLLTPPFGAQSYDGAALYLANCSACHGRFGEGDGPASPELSVVLQDLRYIAQRNDGVFPSELITAIVDGRQRQAVHGPGDMPVWGDAFSASEGSDVAAQKRVAAKIAALVDFLGTIQLEQRSDSN